MNNSKETSYNYIIITSSRKRLALNAKDHYQIELADLHQLLSIHRDLLHVNGDGEDRVGAAVQRDDRERVHKPATRCSRRLVRYSSVRLQHGSRPSKYLE